MATRHATGRLRRPSAMQLNNIGIAEGANLRAVRYLPTDLCATGKRSAGGRAGAFCFGPSLWSQRR
jgi:hypothetical protein